jgi:predicted membrane channel-forming protein YqfA (hemolysin III family)
MTFITKREDTRLTKFTKILMLICLLFIPFPALYFRTIALIDFLAPICIFTNILKTKQKSPLHTGLFILSLLAFLALWNYMDITNSLKTGNIKDYKSWLLN